MKIFRVKYRVVTDDWLGYEVQKKLWYFPFWYIIGVNTHRTIYDAENFIEEHKKKKAFKSEVVKTFK